MQAYLSEDGELYRIKDDALTADLIYVLESCMKAGDPARPAPGLDVRHARLMIRHPEKFIPILQQASQ